MSGRMYVPQRSLIDSFHVKLKTCERSWRCASDNFMKQGGGNAFHWLSFLVWIFLQLLEPCLFQYEEQLWPSVWNIYNSLPWCKLVAVDRGNMVSVVTAELPAPQFSFTVNASFSWAHLTESDQPLKARLLLIHGSRPCGCGGKHLCEINAHSSNFFILQNWFKCKEPDGAAAAHKMFCRIVEVPAIHALHQSQVSIELSIITSQPAFTASNSELKPNWSVNVSVVQKF